MSNSPIRRAQLIAPFGVGAMFVARDGISLITCGLDHWYERESTSNENIDINEFKINEWRLEKRLKVDHFRLPPDYRTKGQGEDIPNCWLNVPFLRFPQWHYCTTCGYLEKLPLTSREKAKCKKCEKEGKTRYLVQVPFVAICDHGHIQDFPWREWVHRSVNPSCQEPMRLVSTGGATLASQQIVCNCGAKRPLASITIAYSNGQTYLTKYLENENEYTCKGKRPWHGTEEGENCDRPLRGSLRSASNVYFADIYSAIYLPREKDDVPSELVATLEDLPFSTIIKTLVKSGAESELTPDYLRQINARMLNPYKDKQIESALKAVLGNDSKTQQEEEKIEGDDIETSFRREEFNALRTERDEDQLRIKQADLSMYEQDITKFFSRIMLIDKLKETRALAGFRRIFPESELEPDDMKSLMWADLPHGKNMWLPAFIVYGEGIFIEFDENKIEEWVSSNYEIINERLKPLVERYTEEQKNKKLKERHVSSKFVLLHTFAHLLMNRLTFECGYSSASLKERLYVSTNKEAPMAGVLIYTAAGDAEGTLGGLVRMGKPGYLEPVIRGALANAQWCSTDPVCMELGARGGQGPNSCNLAACHNCALVPETACEEFNMFLDRALVVGEHANSNLGYFGEIIRSIY
ncbi:MAG: DUF1998 domain-containing protein [Clostridiales bacterium]|nr:DUF1998 domain-containing protein [Clostridiales bacterium]MCF8023144.1 DUF1998 domain-containing protein [Clostridiales bacterium]